MKALKFILTLSLALIILCSCSENKISPANIEEDVQIVDDDMQIIGEDFPIIVEEDPTFTDDISATPHIFAGDSSIERENIDEIRRRTLMSDEEALNYMLEVCHNIMFGIPVKIVYGEWAKGSIGEGDIVEYLFKVTENLTQEDLPEYIVVASQIGDVFEIGKEYCIDPGRLYNALWDSHLISQYNQVISRELLSDDDVKRIREETAKKPLVVHAVAEEASLKPEFISRVDIAAVITITYKREDEYTNTIYDIHYKRNDVLFCGTEFEKRLSDMFSKEGAFRLNTDIEVGETYLVMLEVLDDGAGGGFPMLAARKGAVVNIKSPDYAKYEKAFLSQER